MSEHFDPYHRWLAIPPREQPPNHYRLLGLAKFEADVDVIDSAADRQMAHVRTHQSGKYGEASQKLLNEIAAARVVLLDAAKKSAYDAELRERETPIKKAAPLPQAQPLAAAAPQPKALANDPPMRAASAAPVKTTSPAKKLDATTLAPLLVAGGAGLLVLVLAAGLGAWLFLGGSKETAVVVRPQPTEDPQPAPPPVIPVVPPVRPVVDPPIENPVVADPPVEDEPDDTDPPEEDDPIDPQEPIDPEPVEDPPAEDPPPSEPARSPIADLFPPAAEESRAALPDEATRTTKQKQVEDLFAVSTARSAAQRAAMAEKLIATARDTQSDPAAQYVLLEVARSVASAGGHFDLAAEAIDGLDEGFQVDGLALHADSMDEAASVVVQAAARKELVDAGIKLVDELFAADKFVEAGKLIKSLQAVAAKTRDKEQRAALSTRQGQGSELYKGFKAAQAAIETLKKTPDDAEAALVAGKYFAFIKGDWQRGLVMLSVASDEALKKLAEQEMAVPRTADERKTLADAWVEQSATAKGLEADRQRARAIMWYGKMQSTLTGLAKVELQRKLEALGKVEVDGGKPFQPFVSSMPSITASTNRSSDAVDLLRLIDPASHRIQGTWEKVGKELVSSGSGARILIPHRPPSSYEVQIRGKRVEGNADLILGLLSPDGRPFNVCIDSWGGTASGVAFVDGYDVNAPENPTSRSGPMLRNDVPFSVVCRIERERVEVTIDGKTVVDWNADYSRVSTHTAWRVPQPDSLYLASNNSTYRLTQLTLVSLADGARPTDPVDLLALVDAKKNAVLGDWRVVDGELITPRSPDSMRLQIPAKVPAEYDLDLEVTRNGGGNELAIGMIYQGKQCHVGIDRYSARSTDILGEMNGSRPEVAEAKIAQLLKPGERSRVKCAVRNKSITVFVDGEEIVSYRGDARWSGLNSSWAVPDKTALMLGAWWAEFRIHSFNLTPVGSGAVETKSDETVDLLKLVDTTKHAVHGSEWHIFPDGVMFTDRSERARLTIPYVPPAQYRIDLESRQMAGTGPIVMGLVMEGRQFAIVIGQKSAEAHSVSGKMVGGVQGKEFLRHAQPAKVTFLVKPGHVEVTCDGKPALSLDCDADDLALPEEWKVPDKTTLFLGSSYCGHHVLSLKLTPLTESAAQPSTARGPLDLLPLVDLKVDAAQGQWQLADGRLTSPDVAETGIRLPYIPAQEYDLNFDIAIASTTVDIELRLPYFGNHFMLHIDSSTDAKPGESRPFRCEVRKTGITIFQNGKQAAKVDRDPVAKPMRDNTKAFEIVTQNTTATFGRIRITELGAVGRTLRDATPAAAEDAVYLDDLQETSTRGYGGGIGKHGKTGLPNDGKDPKEVLVGGKTFTHSLFRAADTAGVSSIAYNLDGKYRRFRATAAIADQANLFRFTGPLKFSLVGDGRELWTSAEFTRHGQTEAVDVYITGVRKLELKGTCTGSNNICAWCTWLDPQLSP